jgi:hypothetical protein
MTRRMTQLLARLLTAGGVVLFARLLAAHHPDAATAAESAYLAIVAGAVLGVLVLSPRSTAAVVAGGLWCSVALVLPAAAGTRGALVVAGLVAVVTAATWRSLATVAVPGALDVVAVTLAWQALLRSADLVGSPDLAGVFQLIAPPLLLAAAAIHLARRSGSRRALAALAPLLLLFPGATLPALAALVALGVVGDGRPAGWRSVVAVGAAAALAVGVSPTAGVPLLVLVASLALRHRSVWRWLPAAAAALWAGTQWSGDPSPLVWILAAVPFAALARRGDWPLLAAAMALAVTQGAGLDDPAWVAPVIALLLAAVPDDGAATAGQATWSLVLLAGGGVAAAYPWLRRPLDPLPRPLTLAALALGLAMLAALRLLWRAAPALRSRPAWLLAVVPALLAAPLVAPVEPLLDDPLILTASAGTWSARPAGATIHHLVVDSFLINGSAAADGVVAARLRLVAADGSLRETTLRLGNDTADWAARRLDRTHPRPWLSWIADDGSLAQRYRTDWRLPRAVEVERIEIERSDGLPAALDVALLQVTAR